jgi:hypothetical protein
MNYELSVWFDFVALRYSQCSLKADHFCYHNNVGVSILAPQRHTPYVHRIPIAVFARSRGVYTLCTRY